MDDEQPCKCPAGIPAWVLTFADLMSLLMCFFVLLLSFAEMDVQKFKQIAGSLKVAFGVQRDIKAVEIPKGVNIVAREFSPAPPQPTVINEVRQVTSDDTQQELKLINKLDRLQSEENVLKDKMENMSEAEAESEGLKKQLQQVQAEIAQVEEKLNELQQKMDQVQEKKIKEQAEALSAALEKEIEAEMIDVEANDESITIRIRDKGSFGSGTATLTDDFIEILEIIADELSHTQGNIVVAGHTDDIPIKTAKFPSNWALSAARSVAVAHELLLDDRLKKSRFSIQAFADAKPLVENDSIESRAQNRRVEIVISQDKTDLGISAKEVDEASPDKEKARGSKTAGEKTIENKNVLKQDKQFENVSQEKTNTETKPADSRNNDINNDTNNNNEETPSFIQF
ncbi:MotB family protein [sulfur-oxidizing endosymbiont of Gigantopelta aegis]|uniref:MotB family protein n=1 Tax=sulfur-oxidizing endosymbiont of Gigantopelta aegis TaxID=2794934 RepID=UPI0018DE0F3B|nr:MotB family protein [sulfur-oxidizing endosymbiont of Gigantopelta aegis]